jgi:hypothetical protein
MADRYIKPTSAVFTENSLGSISQAQIFNVFDNDSQGQGTPISVSVPWVIKFVYDCALTFPAGTWMSRFYMSTTFDTSISYNGGPRIGRSGTTTLRNGVFKYTISYFDINDFVSTISFGATTYGTGGTYHIYYLLAQGNSDSGLRVRGKDGKVYWIGTDPNSNIKIRNKSDQIVGLDCDNIYSPFLSRISPCFIRRGGEPFALRYIKKV